MVLKEHYILAIETSCDETAFALIRASGGPEGPKIKVLKNLVSSQIAVHRPFGGVVPNLAKREHLKNLPLLLEKLDLSDSAWKKISAVAVTVGPGLEPALWTGINFAKELAEKKKKPVVGVNHLEGHLYSFLLEKKISGAKNQAAALKKIFPAAALIVSGGHTSLLRLDNLGKKKRLGETRDDAAGEAYDKVARLLGLQYPGGPEIEKLAKTIPDGREDKINFPRPMIHEKNFDFSFSGLKTAVLYYLRDHKETDRAEVAKAFEEAAVQVLVHKTILAAGDIKAKSVLLSGGVSANSRLRAVFSKKCRENKLEFHVADSAYNTDNAAMIAVAAYINILKGKKYPLKANGALPI